MCSAQVTHHVKYTGGPRLVSNRASSQTQKDQAPSAAQSPHDKQATPKQGTCLAEQAFSGLASHNARTRLSTALDRTETGCQFDMAVSWSVLVGPCLTGASCLEHRSIRCNGGRVGALGAGVFCLWSRNRGNHTTEPRSLARGSTSTNSMAAKDAMPAASSAMTLSAW